MRGTKGSARLICAIFSESFEGRSAPAFKSISANSDVIVCGAFCRNSKCQPRMMLRFCVMHPVSAMLRARSRLR
nr:hypothetical protein [uncultured bacterium]